MKKKKWPPEELSDLCSVGKATLEDFKKLGVYSLSDLRNQDPKELFTRLEKLTKTKQDPCVIDVFRCAIEQAKDPFLPIEKRQWHYWSRLRKNEIQID